MKKKITAIIAICMLAVTITACGDSSAPAETTAAPAETTTAAETEKETEAAPEAKDENVSEDDTAGTEDFTLLDVTSDMIETGVYAVDEEQTEIVFSLFTAPSGTPMASMFLYCSDGSGDVICGPYEAETETDEDGMTWTLLTVTDVYTEQEFEMGFAETENGEVYILNTAGAVYEGQYLSADETITYMGSAVALLS